LHRAALATDALTLDEAMRAGLVTVREMPGGVVNTLLVSNRGDRPVYAMAGELLIGGKQDRIIGQSLVLPPRASDVAVSRRTLDGPGRGPNALNSRTFLAGNPGGMSVVTP
jgi:hypothetical protein